MSNPFLGMINIVGFNFAPQGYAFCDGAILSINQNQSLFALLGTTFGGDGRSTFGLPDLRSRVAIHIGNFNGGTNHQLGNKGGEENHTLVTGEIPSHSHRVQASNTDANTPIPTNNVLGNVPTQIYRAAANLTGMSAQAVASQGSSQGHVNMQPFGVLNFIIALQGVFPSRN